MKHGMKHGNRKAADIKHGVRKTSHEMHAIEDLYLSLRIRILAAVLILIAVSLLIIEISPQNEISLPRLRIILLILIPGIMGLVLLIVYPLYRQLRRLGWGETVRRNVMDVFAGETGDILTDLIQNLVQASGARCGVLGVYSGGEIAELRFWSSHVEDRLPYSATEYVSPEFLTTTFKQYGSKSSTEAEDVPAMEGSRGGVYMRVKKLPFSLQEEESSLWGFISLIGGLRGRLGVLMLINPGAALPEASLQLVKDTMGFLQPYVRELQGRIEEKLTLARTVRERREYETRFSNVFEYSRDGMILCDSRGLILDMNSSAMEMTGVANIGAIRGEALERVFLNGMSQDELLRFLHRSDNQSEFEMMFQNSRRDLIYGLVSIGVNRRADGKVREFYLIIKDITQRMKRDSQMMKANAELELLTRRLQEQQSTIIQQEKLASLGQLAAGVAHEINNPLGYVQSNLSSMSHLLREHGARLENESRNELDEILSDSREGIERIGSIVRSLKDFSHVDADLHPVYMDLRRGIEDTLTVAKNFYKYVAEVDVQDDFGERILCYGEKLSQVFLNLTINAAQAIKSMNRDHMGRISIRIRPEGGNVQIEFDDDGPGIGEDVKGKIFDPFYTTKDVGEGTGLGLSISRDIIVNQHHGSLDLVKSSLGGSCFRISIPMEQEEDAQNAEPLEEL